LRQQPDIGAQRMGHPALLVAQEAAFRAFRAGKEMFSQDSAVIRRSTFPDGSRGALMFVFIDLRRMLIDMS
jgi:hypothetical protein